MKGQKQKATGIAAADDPTSSGYSTTGGSTVRLMPTEDMVNHPNHYAPNGVDSFMHMKDQMGKAAFDGFLQGNAIKYVQRYAFKGKPTEDLCKAAFYLFHLALETTDGSPEAVHKVVDRMATTLSHAAEHYEPEAGV